MVICVIISLFALHATKVIAEPPTEKTLPNIKVYAFEKVLDRWGSEQWDSFDKIVEKESNWEILGPHYKNGYTVDGVKSSASGLCGFLDGTWEGTSYQKTEDPYIQISACINYIQERYETPKKALNFHYKNNWY